MTTIADAPAERAQSKFLGVAYVWVAILIFASANSIVLLLIDAGASNLNDGRNPINFCNVLFAGNLCAFLAMSVIYRKQWTRDNLRKLKIIDWASLVVLAAITGALVPSLLFLALANSSVTNAVLVGRIEPFILIFLSTLFMSEKVDIWPTLGAIIAFMGVLLTFYVDSGGAGIELGKGELQAAGAAALTAVSTVVAKVRLKNIPLGIFTVVRTGLGTIIFFVTTIYLLGWEHFADLGSPVLWQWMFFYGAVIVVGGQYFWFAGLKRAQTSDVSLASSFTPIAGVSFAFLLLGEHPTEAVLIGGAVIVAGIGVGQIGTLLERRRKTAPETANTVVEREREVTFKGV